LPSVTLISTADVSLHAQEGVSFIAQTAIAIAAIGYFAAALPVILAVVIVIQRFYLRTSRQLRVLE
jgi:hypothetical protein